MNDGRAVLDPADVGLPQPHPLTEQALGDATRPINGVVVRVGAVGTGHQADVLGGEGIPELVGLPELRRYVGWGDELVA
ncbi:MAG: hypothetical protein ACRDSL_23320 [Pseudonocardiaceae bacterium]